LPEETDTSIEDTQEGKEMSDITQTSKVPTSEPISPNSMITCKLVSVCSACILLPCLEKGMLPYIESPF
jgi:hypothetical protein